MNNYCKVSILWIIALIFFPIGLQMVISNNPILIFLSFAITLFFLISMIRSLIKAIIENRKEKNYE